MMTRELKSGMIAAMMGVCVCGAASFAYFAGRTYDGADAPVREAVRLKEAEIALKTAEAQLIETKVQAAARLAAIRQRARIAAAKPVEASAILLAVYWHILPPALTLFAAAGGGLVLALRRYPFTSGGVTAYVTRREAAMLAERAIYVQGLDAQARAAAYEETISRDRVHDAAGVFAALRGAWKMSANALQSALPETSDSAPAQPVVSFREMVQAGKFTHGKPLLFGFTADGAARTGSWADCYSLGIAGLSGYGKSSLIRFLISESLLTGVVDHFYVIDPHYPNPESLLASLGALCDAPQVMSAKSNSDIPRLLQTVNAEIDARLQGEIPCEPVSVVIIDELLRAVKFEGVSELIERIGCESRKAGVYGVFAAQSWLGAKSGGTTARDNLTALLTFRMKRKQAQTLLQDSELARQVTRLNKGQALFAPVAGDPEILTIPFASREDMREVVSRLNTHDDAPRRVSSENMTQDTVAQTSPHNAATTAAETGEKLSTAAVIESLKLAMSIRELWQKSGLEQEMTYDTFKTKVKPSSRRAFTLEQEAALRRVHAQLGR